MKHGFVVTSQRACGDCYHNCEHPIVVRGSFRSNRYEVERLMKHLYASQFNNPSTYDWRWHRDLGIRRAVETDEGIFVSPGAPDYPELKFREKRCPRFDEDFY